MTITLSALQKQRRDTAANWTAENPTLLAGEIGIEADTGKIKIGNGSSAWASLGYQGIIPASGTYPLNQLIMPLGTAGAPPLTFTGDVNTGIYSPGTDQLALATGGTGRIFVNAAGNTGIGTATTSVPLTIQADSGQASIRIAGRSADGLSYAEFTNNAQTLTYGYFSSGPTYLAAGAGTTEAIRISSTGQLQCGTLGTAAAPVISFSADTNTGIYSPGADQVAISTGGSGRLFVDASGRVGINTANPLQQFHVNGNAVVGGSPAARYSSFTVAGDIAIQAGAPLLNFVNAAGSTRFGYVYHSGTGGNFDILNQENGGLTLGTNNQERLRITSAGLVGVGTSVPRGLVSVSNNTVGGGVVDSSVHVGYSVADFYGFRITNSNDPSSTYGGLLKFQRGTGAVWSDALTINNAGNVGIGTTSPSELLHLTANANPTILLTDNQTANTNGSLSFRNGTYRFDTRFNGGNGVFIFTANNASTEYGRFDTSGRLLVGTSSAYAVASGFSGVTQQIVGNDAASFLRYSADNSSETLWFCKSRNATLGQHTVLQSGDGIARFNFQGSDGTNFITAARIDAEVDGTPGANAMPGRIVLSTTAAGASSPTERMRIDNAGNVLISGTSTDPGFDGTSTAIALRQDGRISARGPDNFPAMTLSRGGTDGTLVDFVKTTTAVGSISVTTTATAFNTSSDYRLKENVTAVTDGITRLQQLKPSRFNFIADPAKTVDGFIAHEVQAVVPEAITGEKDAVDDEGNPIYQGIDQSKLVPLLTAALQEAVAKIESLEARLTAAGI